MHLLFKRHLSGEHPHILAFSDSSSAIGWLYHSTFNPSTNLMHDVVARYLASFMIDEEASLFSEHIAGNQNVIADCLSRDFHLNNTELTQLLSSAAPSQTPKNFRLFSLPENLFSWIELVVGSLPPSQGSRPTPSPSNLALLQSGKLTSNTDSSSTPSLTTIPSLKPTCSLLDLPTLSGKTSMDLQQKINSRMEQLTQQSQAWFRPSGRTYGLTPHWTNKDNDVSSYKDY